MAKYKVGDKVKIMEERTYSMPSHGSMDKYLGKVMTIRSTDESGDYKMLEDNGYWTWNDNMISGLVNDKVELHPDFAEWYGEIMNRWTIKDSAKAFAIYLINQIGFRHLLEDAKNNVVEDKYKELSDDMINDKEKYTRAILDDNWTVRKEKLYEVIFNVTENNNRQMLMKDAEQSFIEYESENEGYCTQKFTEKEIKAIDERYFAFAEPVEED